MRQLFTLLFSLLLTSSAYGQKYDMSDEIIKSAPLRSTYYTKASAFDFGNSYDDFIAKADRSVPVVVHSHGCAGIGTYDQLAKSFYTDLGYYFVLLDFHKRGDATASCSGGESGGFAYHGDLRTRLPARIKELVANINALRNHGFKTIYATGHSEGGIVVQFLQKDVDGVIIHSMACAHDVQSRYDTRNVRTLHLVSLNDPLLGRSSGKEVCTDRPNYTAIISKARTHSSFAEPIWGEKIKEFLSVK